MIVRELVTKLGFQLNQAQLNQAERGVQNLRSQAEVTAQSFRNMFAAFASFATVQSIVRIGDEMQSLRTRIGMLPQTIGDAGAAFDMVAKHASDARVSITAYGQLYNRIGNGAKEYVKTQEDLLGITDTISRALVVGGATAAESSSVMLQFAQALGSGVLQGDEFRAMAEAAPQYLDKLSEAMNIPRDQLKKMASEGKLTTKAVLEATRKMAGYFEEKFKEMPMTVGGAMTIVANKWSTMIDHLNRESLFITRIANFILGGMEKIEQGIDYLIEKFDGLGNIVQFTLALFAALIMTKVLPALAMWAIANAAAIGQFLLFAAAIVALAAVLEDLYSYFTGGESVLGTFIEYLQSGSNSANALIGILGALGLAALVAGVRMAAAWVMALGPIGLALAALTAIVAAITWIAGNSDIPGVGETDAMGNPTGVTAASVASDGGKAGNTVNKTTNVSVTVPPGTTAEQAAFLNTAANKAFSQDTDNIARDLAMMGP